MLAEVRKAKSVEKRSLRTEVRRLVVEDIAEQLEALRAAETDLCQAGVVLDLELRDAGERSVTNGWNGASSRSITSSAIDSAACADAAASSVPYARPLTSSR